MNRTCSRQAFTLIEILVVVAIVALLVAVLVPALSAARDQSLGVVCKTRLRELYNGHALYAHEAKGAFPHYDWWLWDGDPSSNERQALFYPRIYAGTGGVRPTDSSRWVEFGQIFRYVKNKETYFCPKDSLRRGGQSIGGGANGKKPIHSYARLIEPHDFFNQHRGGGHASDGRLTAADFLRPEWLRKVALTPPLPATPPDGPFTISPNRFALMYEEHPGIDEGDKLVPYDPANVTYALNDGWDRFFTTVNDYTAIRHRGKANMLYWDGQVRPIDGNRFNRWPDDKYAAHIAIGGPVR